jgi:peptidoglycan hydrolase-like protein with peptidoglycan-binding domain
MNMKQHGSRFGITALSMALALGLGTSLGGAAFAQGTATPPAQMQPATPTGQAATTGMPTTTAPGMSPATPNEEQSYKTEAAKTGAAKVSPATVKEAQQQLKSQGLYNGAVDGRLGPETRAAVKHFQQKNNLKVTANLDQETLQRLMAARSHG